MRESILKKYIKLFLIIFLVLVTFITFEQTEVNAASRRKISKCSIKLSQTSYSYTGNYRKPTVTVKYGSTTLRNGTNYTISYSNCKNVGTAKVVIKGKGTYTGTITKYYSIVPRLNKYSMSIYRKKTAYVKGYSSTKVTYTSSNKNVATVSSSGKITAVAKGTAYITVKSNGKSAKCKVTVNNPYLTKTSLILAKSKSFTLAVKNGVGTVTWSSSNKNVATVTSKGVITAKGAGTAYIYAKVSGITLKCTVKVVTPVLNKTSLNLYIGNTYDLNITGTSSAVTFKSSNTAVATVNSSGIVKAVKEGNASIYATVNGITLTCKLVVKDYSLNNTSVQLIGDQKYVLKLTGADSSKVTFSSDKPNNIAVSNQGEIAGACNFAETAIITATYLGRQYKCNVTYDTVDMGNCEIYVGDEYKLTVDGTACNKGYKTEWSSSNTDVASVNQNGVILGKSGGDVDISITFTTNVGKYTKTTTSKIVPLEDTYTTDILTDNEYDYVKDNEPVTNSFENAQDADLVLSSMGFNKSTGNGLYHPNGMAVYTDDSGKTYFYVADTWNNRVLMYDEIPNKDSVPALVLGQKSFETNKAGYGLDEMNWPVGVAVCEGYLYVTDTENNRILVWEGIPTTSGEAADYAITAYDKYEENNTKHYASEKDTLIMWPWAIWTDGDKLMVTSTASSRVLIWNELPTKEDIYADNIIFTGDSSTPRTIVTDGEKFLLVGDHNLRENKCVMNGAHVWKDFSSLFTDTSYVESNGDFTYALNKGQPGGCITSTGKLVLLYECQLKVWDDGVIESANDEPDYLVGGGCIGDEDLYMFMGGDFNQMVETPDGSIYISLYNGSKIVGYSKDVFPNKDYTNKKFESCVVDPDIVVGASDVDDEPLYDNYLYQNLNMCSNGKQLVAIDDLNRALLVWKSIPDENSAKPDVVYRFDDRGDMADVLLYTHMEGDNEITGVIAIGRWNIFIWDDINDIYSGKPMDKVIRNRMGSVEFNTLSSISYDGKYFYLSDNGDKNIYVYDGLFEKESEPYLTIDDCFGNINVQNLDGATKLAVANGSSEAWILDIDFTNKTYEKNTIAGWYYKSNKNFEPEFRGFNGCSEVFITKTGQVIASDTAFVRVIIWNSIEDAISGSSINENEAIVLGYGDDYYDTEALGSEWIDSLPQNGVDTFFCPYFVYYDGQFLWVGEFKFSGRLLRFSGVF